MKICIIVSGEKDSIFGRRIGKLYQHTPALKNAAIFYRDDKHKLVSIFSFINKLIRFRPELVYVESVSFSSCIAVDFLKPILGFKYIISTGDDYYHIVKQLYGPFRGFLASLLEDITYNIADIIITRSPLQKDYFITKGYNNVFFINEGVDTEIFKPFKVNELKQKLQLENVLTIGLTGSIVWHKKYNYCYGWEIVEIINILREKPIKALIIGGGDGIARLKKLAESYGISDKIIFTGKVTHEQIPYYINCMDVCFSTQSNNMVGKMRIPTKLEEYLACGKFVISTDVGYAKIILKDIGTLVPFKGIKDDSYPGKAAKIIEEILSDGSILDSGKKGIDIAKEKFDFKKLSQQLEEIICYKT